MQEAAAAAAANNQQDDDDPSPSPATASQTTSSPNQAISPILMRQDHSPFLEPLSSIASLHMPPSRYPITADGFHHQFSPVNSLPSPTYEDPRFLVPVSNGVPLSSPRNGEPKSYPPPVEHFSTYPLYNWSYKQHQTMHIPSQKAWPRLSLYYRPHRLEEIAPRETMSLIITLFFDFL